MRVCVYVRVEAYEYMDRCWGIPIRVEKETAVNLAGKCERWEVRSFCHCAGGALIKVYKCILFFFKDFS